MTLNVEQYEYMNGPNEAAGIRILVHHQNDQPRIRDYGQVVPPGAHSLVAVQRIEVCFYIQMHNSYLHFITGTHTINSAFQINFIEALGFLKCISLISAHMITSKGKGKLRVIFTLTYTT